MSYRTSFHSELHLATEMDIKDLDDDVNITNINARISCIYSQIS